MAYFKGQIHAWIGVRDRSSLTIAAACLMVLIVHWAVIFLFIAPRLDSLDFLRLHYTASVGVDWIGDWWNIFVFPAAGFFVFFINGLLSGILAVKSRMLGLAVLVATLIIEVFLAAGGIMAVILNS